MRSALLMSVALLLLCAVAVGAADINGRWLAQVPMRTMLTDYFFTFKVNGDTLTGSVSFARGDSLFNVDLTEGKVSGDELSFVVVSKMRDTVQRSTFKGKAAGEVIEFVMTDVMGTNAPVEYEFKAKRRL